ncbi:hypothetical protein [Nitratireductor sp. XY-223]|uniref:hypothetical protein n=1 Tax=Nitratireductor sp. XY-223 TaxID=2561926 RepID=UPI0010AA6BF9|nr:hypothetical protein [Nitratireductor sp. XY-223]
MKELIDHLRNVEENASLDWQHHVTQARAAADTIERLAAELEKAVEVAFEHGAADWVKSNHPDHYGRLSK